ncbi:MAG: indolepyruvate oxidoreductase subunit beta [Methanoculleaceae archaeon]
MSGGFDVILVGIGGQGVIMASNILGVACLEEGREVRAAETHGMAQRGGSVECHVRIDGRFGPMIPPGGADLMISFDLLETLRYRHYLPPGGTVVQNDHIQVPTSIFPEQKEIPAREEILGRLDGLKIVSVDAEVIAREAGSPLSQNVVMIGLASHFLPLRPESLLTAVRKNVPPKTIDINTRAFANGRAAYSEG